MSTVFLLLSIAAAPAPAEIAQKALDNNLFATVDAQATIDIDILKGDKVTRQRTIQTFIKRVDGMARSFVEFTKPSDVAGTRFLAVEESGGKTQQYIYLPAFKKVKRIVGAQKTESFMGTDFAYSDLEGRDVDTAEWKGLADEKVMGEDCFVIEGKSKKPEDETYGRIKVWVHKAHFIPLKTEFYDKKTDAVVKLLEVKKLSKKDERFIASESLMRTLAKETATRLTVTSIDMKTPIPEDRFTKEALER